MSKFNFTFYEIFITIVLPCLALIGIVCMFIFIPQWVEKEAIRQKENPAPLIIRTTRTFTIEGCDYLYILGEHSTGYAHKGNCRNNIHNFTTSN